MTRSDLEDALEQAHPASFGWALVCCGFDREEAREVLQEAYVRVLDGRAAFDGRSSLKTWLFGVVRRTAAERRRRAWLRGIALGRFFATRPDPPPSPGPDAAAAESEERRALRRALAELPRRQREVLHLVFYQDLTVEAVAGVLAISVGAARTHYHRGKERLRRRLGA